MLDKSRRCPVLRFSKGYAVPLSLYSRRSAAGKAPLAHALVVLPPAILFPYSLGVADVNLLDAMLQAPIGSYLCNGVFGLGYLRFDLVQEPVFGLQEFLATVGAFLGAGKGFLEFPQGFVAQAAQGT